MATQRMAKGKHPCLPRRAFLAQAAGEEAARLALQVGDEDLDGGFAGLEGDGQALDLAVVQIHQVLQGSRTAFARLSTSHCG